MLLPYADFTPLLLADRKGLFAEEGIEVEFVRAAAWAQLLPGFVDGDIDVFAGAVTVGLLNAIARGAEARLVADKGRVAPGERAVYVLARRDLVDSGRLKSAADLRGLKISRTRLSVFECYLSLLLRHGGLTDSDVEATDLLPPVAAKAMADGRLDVWISGEPWVTRLVASGAAVRWTPEPDVLPHAQLAVLAFGPRLLRREREAGVRFMRAYLKAIHLYRQGKTPENIEVMVAQTGLDTDTVAKMEWPVLSADGAIHLESVALFQRWAFEKGYMDRVMRTEEFWDGAFVAEAAASLDRAAGGAP